MSSLAVTPQMLQEAVRDQVATRHRQLLAEREMIKAEQARLAVKERMLEREIAECVSAANFFGVRVREPVNPEVIKRLHQQARALHDQAEVSPEGSREREFLQERARQSERELRTLMARSIEEHGQLQLIEVEPQAITLTEFAHGTPKIKDVALEQLRSAFPHGRKAAEIRKYVEATYSIEIHEKTIGMTLYRLSKDNLVHRIGQTWFYGPQAGQTIPASAENPGAPAPGQPNESDQERRNA